MKAPPLTANLSLIGTAFDYLVRFWLERRHKAVQHYQWIAEHAVDRLGVLSGDYVLESVDGKQRLIPTKEWESVQSKGRPAGYGSTSITFKPDPAISGVTAAARGVLKAAKDDAAAYVGSGVVTDELLRSALLLAGLDVVYRTWQAKYFSTSTTDKDVEDLRNLWNVLEEGDLRDMAEPVRLNPTFGEASGMVGGADADFIAGDTLVDVKTTKNGRFTRDHFNQLAGYCVLDYLERKNGMWNDASLNRAGVYFSRHGTLMTVDTGRIYNAPGFAGFVDEFCRLANPAGRKSKAYGSRESLDSFM